MMMMTMMKRSPRAVMASASRRVAGVSVSALRVARRKQWQREDEQQQRQLWTSTTGRPISPHVSIYKFPLPALTSITNRATGVAAWVGFGGGALLATFGSCDIPSYIHAFQTAAPALVPIAKGLVAFPLVYHYVAGLRHLFWDETAKGLDLESVDKSSYAVIGASAFLTLALMFYTIN
eukprot:TRINITY_DN66947_c6_g2_i2.p2 TRINITY_DN66947_c6_g2~~TRINITY_DN66947_c6_g2_i2.p2  ORF type:complete len:190 (+),score=88.98 TRINITY_DN66947_c6_g2_i2:37-570(+)